MFNPDHFKVTPPPYHAFYSDKAAQQFGYGVWETEDGRQVAVTSIHHDCAQHERTYRWDDRVDRGIVVRHVRDGQPGKWGRPIVVDSFWLTDGEVYENLQAHKAAASPHQQL